MKITKRQLLKIIREEKARIIKEEHFEGWNAFELESDALEPIVDEFREYSLEQLQAARAEIAKTGFDLTQKLLAAIDNEMQYR